MEIKDRKPSAEDASDTIISTPRFDEAAEATARPVVPLALVNDTNFNNPLARGTRAGVHTAGKVWTRGLMLALALVTVVAAATVAIYRNTVTSQSPDTPQKVSEISSSAASEPATEPAAIPPARTNVSDVSDAPKSLPESEVRSALPVRYEPKRSDWKEAERRRRADDVDEGDTEKIARRERKEEKKLAERRRKETVRVVERQRGAEKEGEPKPRLIGIYTEKH